MGTTSMTAEQVEDIVEQLTAVKFAAVHYNRMRHNCVDFAQELCSWLGIVNDVPNWCHRALTMARLMNFGADKANSKAYAGQCRAPRNQSHSGQFPPPTSESVTCSCDAIASDQAEAIAGTTPDDITPTSSWKRRFSQQCTSDVFQDFCPQTPRLPEEFPVSPKTPMASSTLYEPDEESEKEPVPLSVGIIMDEDVGFCVPVPSVWSSHGCTSTEIPNEVYPSLLRSLGHRHIDFVSKAAGGNLQRNRRLSSTVWDIDNLSDLVADGR